eukprot:2965388-Rhodomonas_salina.1
MKKTTAPVQSVRTPQGKGIDCRPRRNQRRVGEFVREREGKGVELAPYKGGGQPHVTSKAAAVPP